MKLLQQRLIVAILGLSFFDMQGMELKLRDMSGNEHMVGTAAIVMSNTLRLYADSVQFLVEQQQPVIVVRSHADYGTTKRMIQYLQDAYDVIRVKDVNRISAYYNLLEHLIVHMETRKLALLTNCLNFFEPADYNENYESKILSLCKKQLFALAKTETEENKAILVDMLNVDLQKTLVWELSNKGTVGIKLCVSYVCNKKYKNAESVCTEVLDFFVQKKLTLGAFFLLENILASGAYEHELREKNYEIYREALPQCIKDLLAARCKIQESKSKNESKK